MQLVCRNLTFSSLNSSVFQFQLENLLERLLIFVAPSGRSGYGGDRSTTSGGYGGSSGFAGMMNPLIYQTKCQTNSASLERGGYSVREQLPLPTKPPYTVHLGNMSFDATEGDIQQFFVGCSVTNVRIVEDKLERKPKGFGYAEFSTLEGLKKALEFNNSQFQGRNIRVSVAEPRKCYPCNDGPHTKLTLNPCREGSSGRS